MVEKKLMIEIVGALTLLTLLVGIIYFKVFNVICTRDQDGNLNCDPWRFIQKKSILELAMECAYVRCAEGCDSGKIDRIERRAPDFSCREECNKVPTDAYTFPGARVCSFHFPIELELSEEYKPYEIKKDYDIDNNNADDCIYLHNISVYPDFNNYADLSQEISRVFGTPPIVGTIINPTLSDNYEAGNGCHSYGYETLNRAEIKPGKIFIGYGTVGVSSIGACSVLSFAYVSNSPFYNPIRSRQFITVFNDEYYRLDAINGLIVKILDRPCNESLLLPEDRSDFKLEVDAICDDSKSIEYFCGIEEKEICGYKLQLPYPITGYITEYLDISSKKCLPFSFQIISVRT